MLSMPSTSFANIYKFVNQLEIIGSEKRMPDGIIYINGLPVVVYPATLRQA
jgi:type I restriction enzyme R subunit